MNAMHIRMLNFHWMIAKPLNYRACAVCWMRNLTSVDGTSL